jgi:hypothetical protein
MSAYEHRICANNEHANDLPSIPNIGYTPTIAHHGIDTSTQTPAFVARDKSSSSVRNEMSVQSSSDKGPVLYGGKSELEVVYTVCPISESESYLSLMTNDSSNMIHNSVTVLQW